MADVLEMLHRIDRKLDRMLGKQQQPRKQPELIAHNNGADRAPTMTIAEFCKWVGISERQYYKQRERGIGPKEMRLGHKIIRISREEAQAWAERMMEAK